MPADSLFKTLDAAQLQSDFVQLLCRTARDKGRVEITNCDGKSCVMISKDELDSLERALEILSNTSAGHALQNAIAHCAMLTADGLPEKPHQAA